MTVEFDGVDHGRGKGNAKGATKKRRRAEGDDDEDELVALDEADLMDVLEAVKATKQREAAAELDSSTAGASNKHKRGGHDSDSEGDSDAPDATDADGSNQVYGGTVSFVDGTKSMTAKRAKKKKDSQKVRDAKRNADNEDEPPAKAPRTHLEAGALAHSGSTNVPGASRSQVFGAEHATSFQQLGISKGGAAMQELTEHIERHKFSVPTAVQKRVIPYLLQGFDVMMRAPTGTGKTVAYLAPIIHHLSSVSPRLSRAEGTHALVVTPTRELTIQVHDVASMLVKRFIWLVVGMLIGGENRHHEKTRLRKGIIILVATPGRLLDHLKSTTSFVVSELRWLVLDEADRLLDMGFEHTLAQIVQLIDERCVDSGSQASRQSVLVSATLHQKLGHLADKLLKNPVPVGVAASHSKDGVLVLAEPEDKDVMPAYELPKGLHQLYMDVPVKLRLATLLGTIKLCFQYTPKCKLVVFLTTCDSVEFHHIIFARTYAERNGPLVDSPILKLHGDMSAGDRTDSMMAFHRAEQAILLCTDVAARGLDFPAVTHIVQYDPPGEVAEYVQRVGRSARMGKRGVAILFLASMELGYKTMLEEAGISIIHQKIFPSLNTLPKADKPLVKGLSEVERNRAVFQGAMDAAHYLQNGLMLSVGNDKELQALAGDAFRSYVGAYATHPNHLKEVFHIKKIHLGHVAHSFALKEQPKKLGQSASKQARKAKKEKDALSQARNQRNKAMVAQSKQFQTVGGIV